MACHETKNEKSKISSTLSSNYIVLKIYQFQQATPAADHLAQLQYLGKKGRARGSQFPEEGNSPGRDPIWRGGWRRCLLSLSCVPKKAGQGKQVGQGNKTKMSPFN